MAKKLTKKATKTLKKISQPATKSARNERAITVKNADGDADTTATILIQNKIKYTPKVSVIIPVYNVEEYLRECLDSVINQTLREIEIICVDDGSTDNSLEILKEYAARDPRITVITQQNLHAGVARNAGLTIAHGEYLSFLDSDDFFELNMLEDSYHNCIKNKAEMAICNGRSYFDGKFQHLNWVVDQNILKNYDSFSCADPYIAKHIFQIICGWTCNKLYDMKLVKRNKFLFSSQHHHNDTSFVMSNIITAKKIIYIQDLYYNYRIVTNSISRNKDKQVECFYKSLIETYNNIHKLSNFYNIEQSFINYVIDFSVNHYKKLQQETSKQQAKNLCLDLHNKFVSDKEPEYFYNQSNFLQFKNNICGSKNIIPIILSSDNNYAPYMYVTMFSALKNAKATSFYDFYLMVPGKFSKKNEKQILNLKKNYDCDIHFLSLNDQFKDIKMSIPHISYVTYFRLLAGDLLPQKYDKCIYIDTDICVCSDLWELFSYPIGDNYVAGVIAATYVFSGQANCERLKINSISSYVNAGVLLMNLKQIRDNNMTEKFVSMIANNYQSQDQDIVNVACYNKIKILPLKFNLMTKYKDFWNKNSAGYNRLERIYGDTNIQQAIASPVIIHYANPEKPWNDKTLPLADVWLKYANMAKELCTYNIKPYLFFPYYLLANVFMKRVYIPILKFRNHTRAILYSHSHHGKIDTMNAQFNKIATTVQSGQANINKQIENLNKKYQELQMQNISQLQQITTVLNEISESLKNTKTKRTRKTK